MRRAARACTVAIATALAAAGAAPAIAAGAAAARHEIVIQGLQYVPPVLHVRRGDVVVWRNRDPFPHTATAAGAFDSRSIAAGGVWRWKARRSGRFDYVCTLHSTMRATLQVD